MVESVRTSQVHHVHDFQAAAILVGHVDQNELILSHILDAGNVLQIHSAGNALRIVHNTFRVRRS